MAEGKVLVRASRNPGDIAVDGLLRGVAGGIVMTIVLEAAGLLSQLSIQFVLSRFDPTGGNSAVTGLLAHLATAAIYGVLFALLAGPITHRLGSRLVLVGLAYGAVLLLLSRGLMASELGAPLRALPASGWSLAHLAYGLTLGWLMARR